jgi:hypothetical protein
MAVDEQRRVAELEANLRVYEELAEDLMAQRVFAKARKQVTTWLTFGGIVALLAGIIGFTNLQSEVSRRAKEKIDTLATNDVKGIVRGEADRRIKPMLQDERERVDRAIDQLTGLLPIGPSRTATRAMRTPPPMRPRVDYSARMLPVRDSGPESSVVGFAVASALEYQLRARERKTIRISPRYLYYYARKAGGLDLRSDTGANLPDAMTVLAARGAVAESAWPYVAGRFASGPPPGVARAKHYRARNLRLQGVNEIRAALQRYGPVVAGITLYASFNSPRTAATGVVPDPKPGEAIEGGHAICIVGYDDAARRFTFENSWGPRWGDKGYGSVSYDYVRDHGAGAWALTT